MSISLDEMMVLSEKEQETLFKKIKSIRSTAKNAVYASQYGAGAERIAITAGISKTDAEILHKAYWKKNWAIKAMAKEQKTKYVDNQEWLYNPLSKFWYTLRTKKDIASTLIQGSAVYCFDTWISHIVSERPQLTATFHDECVLQVKKGFREEIKTFLNSTIKETNEALGLNRELGISIAFGSDYGAIH